MAGGFTPRHTPLVSEYRMAASGRLHWRYVSQSEWYGTRRWLAGIVTVGHWPQQANTGGGLNTSGHIAIGWFRSTRHGITNGLAGIGHVTLEAERPSIPAKHWYRHIGHAAIVCLRQRRRLLRGYIGRWRLKAAYRSLLRRLRYALLLVCWLARERIIGCLRWSLSDITSCAIGSERYATARSIAITPATAVILRVEMRESWRCHCHCRLAITGCHTLDGMATKATNIAVERAAPRVELLLIILLVT